MVNLRVSAMEESETLLQPCSCLGIGVRGSYCCLPSTPHVVQKHLCQVVAVEVYSLMLALCLLESRWANSAVSPDFWFIMFSVSSISLGALEGSLIFGRVLPLPSPG